MSEHEHVPPPWADLNDPDLEAWKCHVCGEWVRHPAAEKPEVPWPRPCNLGHPHGDQESLDACDEWSAQVALAYAQAEVVRRELGIPPAEKPEVP